VRVDFTQAVLPLLAEDAQSVFITGDLGYNALEAIAKMLGRRFLNAGVAEQNLIGVSAGLSLAGYHPWVYSIAPFVTYRCLEQIRNDICLHKFNVKIVGNGGGFTYGIAGSTHHALEDLAVLKSLPNMQLFFPCTNNHVSAAVHKMAELSAPAYLRLSISGFAANDEPLSENPETLTRCYRRDAGKGMDGVTVIGVGHAAQIALTAEAKHGLKEWDVDLFGICRYPFDFESDRELAESVRKTRRVVVIEEHYQPGGMGESLKLALPNTDTFKVMSAVYSPSHRYGGSAFLLRQSGLTPEALVEAVKQIVRETQDCRQVIPIVAKRRAR
jgi:transketolase